MSSENARSVPQRTSVEVESPSASRHHHHHHHHSSSSGSGHRNGSSHRSSQLSIHETLMQNNIGSEEMMGLQVEHRVTSRRHHSHHHRHRHRSHHSEPPPASAQLAHHEEENNKEALTVGEQKQIEEGKQKETAVAHEAPETSRASTRSSRLPARRSERGSVAGPGSTFGNISFHEVTHPTGEGGAAAEQSSRKPSQLSVARSSSANFPSTSELSAMMKKDRAVPVVAATATAKAKASAAPAVTQAPQNSATHSISFFSSSRDGDIDFHTETQQKTGTAAATGVSPQLFTSHTTSSVDFFESSQDSAMQPAAAAAAAAAVAPKDATMSSKKSGHHSRSSQPQLRQSMDVNSKRSRTDDGRAASANATAIADKKKEPSEQNRTAASSTQADVRVASLNSVPSPLPAGAAPESPAPASSAAAAAAAALAALQTTPQPDAIVRSWQADVTPNRHDPPSSLTSSICRGRDEIATAITDDHKEHRSHRSRSSQKPAEHRGSNASPTDRQAGENGAAVPASSSHRHQHGESSHHRRHASTPPAATASSLHRDSRSSSHYDKAVYPPPPPSASVKKEDDGKEREESKSTAADSPEQQQQRGSQAASEKPFAASSVGSRPAASANGRTPQRTRASSATAGRHSTEFKPFQLSTERRSTVRRVSSPQAYVPRDPLLAMPKEERERLMALPHDALNAPGMWRLDMRYEEDRKEYYRQTHLVDPMTRTKPSTRQFYIPEQADLFGMYPNIQMTTDEEGNEVVVHLAPVPIRGESFVKERKPYTPPRASPPRKSAIEENLAYPPPEPAAVAASLAAESKCDANATVGQPGSGLSGLVWGYGEEARARPGGLTPPRGRVVSDITAPYRRNPAKSTGQIGHLGGDGTLNIFRVSASAENDGHEFSHMRDISQASTSFAVMQPTPSPSVPTTTNSDYGQQQQHQQQSPHCYAEASSPPPPQAPSNDGERSRREGRESGAVVLQPSVGGNSDSRSPSDGVFAVPQGAAAAAAVVMPMAIQTGGDADDNDAYSEVKSVEKQQQQQQQPKQPSAQEVKPTDTDTKPQPEEQNASERSSRRREQASMSGEPTTSERCSRKDGKASAPSEKSTCSNAKLSSVAAAAAAVPASKEKSKADTVAASKPESVSSSSHKPSSRHAPAPSSSSLPSTKASASAKAEPHLAAPPPAAAGTATSSSSGLHTPTSAMPDAAYPLPSPTPLLPVSASSRASKERKRRTDRREDADSHNSALKAEKAMNEVKDAETSKERRRKEKPSRASSSTDVPPPLPPPPSVQRATTTTTATTTADPAVATAPSSSAARTQEASVYMTDVASARDEHYDPTATSELRAPAATTAPAPSAAPVSAKTTSTCRSSSSSVAVDALLTTTVAGKASSEARESRPGGSSSSSRLRHHRASVSSATSAASSSAPESKAPSEAHSSAFSHPYTYASELNTPDSSVREPRGSSANNGSHRHNNVSAGGSFQDKPMMSEGGTQTEFVFVLDPLQGRQFLQREQELVEQLRQRSQNVLYITDTRRNSSGISTSLSTPRQSQVLPQQQQQQRLQSGDRSVSPSEQRAAGISTGVSPTHMRRTSYANTSTNVRNLLRWT